MSHDTDPPPPSEMSDDCDVTKGADELGTIIALAEAHGFGSEFDVPDDDDDSEIGTLHCLGCEQSGPAADFVRAWSSRLEGASNPADMLHISALTCPRCGVGGVFITPYGSTASIRQTAVLHALPPAGGDAPTEGT